MRYVSALRGRLSQRGAFLLILAIVDVIYAIGLMTPPPATRISDTYALYAFLLPLPIWGGLWIAVGALCLLQAWTPRDRPAYVAAAGLKIFWALLHIGGWAAGVLPRGYVLGAIWLLAAAGVMIVATVRKEAADGR